VIVDAIAIGSIVGALAGVTLFLVLHGMTR